MSDRRFPYRPGPLEHNIENMPQSRAVPATRLGRSVAPGQLGLPPAVLERINSSDRRGRGHFQAFSFLAQPVAAIIVPAQPNRNYFFILNNSAANRIFVGFDADPNAGNGVILELNLGFYEPWVVPDNAIHVSAAGANTPGYIIVSTETPDDV